MAEHEKKKKKKNKGGKKRREIRDEEEFYSDTEDAVNIELRLAFREADRLKKQVAFWKAKCQEHLPELAQVWESEEGNAIVITEDPPAPTFLMHAPTFVPTSGSNLVVPIRDPQ